MHANEVIPMRYLLLLWGDEAAEQAMSEAERVAMIEAHRAFSAGLRERGRAVSGDAIQPSATAVVVRPDGSVSDGPFAETKEQLGGYYVVECADRADAIDIARAVPASPGLRVEVRELAGL